VFAVRCLAVSDFDPVTARTVFLKSSLGQALQEIGFTVIPLLVGFTTCASAFFAGDSKRIRGFAHRRSILYATLALISALAYLLFTGFFWRTQWTDLILVAIALFMLVFSFYFGQRKAPVEAKLYFLLGAVTPLMIGAVLPISGPGSLLSRDIWLPGERIQLSNGDSYDAYLLSESSGHLMFMTDLDRVPFLVDEKLIVSRAYCRRIPDSCQSAIVQPSTPSPTPSPRHS
jgi:hypothetical protein